MTCQPCLWTLHSSCQGCDCYCNGPPPSQTRFMALLTPRPGYVTGSAPAAPARVEASAPAQAPSVQDPLADLQAKVKADAVTVVGKFHYCKGRKVCAKCGIFILPDSEDPCCRLCMLKRSVPQSWRNRYKIA